MLSRTSDKREIGTFVVRVSSC